MDKEHSELATLPCLVDDLINVVIQEAVTDDHETCIRSLYVTLEHVAVPVEYLFLTDNGLLITANHQ